MEYTSTRDNNLSVSAAYAIKTGLAPDGGLFVPKSFPRVFGEELLELAQLSYAERAVKILEKFLTDFSEAELSDCAYSAYNKEK
ncbi:MAG: threonine synthase, partial [Clostridia bacterium]|nr:threonine synthase [Clostridia bacterium]